ncbi:OB-fold domain-containing protein [Streptomyces sp. NPDC093085]|uniref:Zn-ribbon domain-containing OB-fold protein n=1 Tax=Streptomyces sp. NPDC093085 TaxID=3155068 RepID=UPI00344501DE
MSGATADPGMAALTGPYYAALARGELPLQHCAACDRAVLYPRHRCPYCRADSLGWTAASGRGVLHSFTVQRLGEPSGFGREVPYALGVVKLVEGVQLLGRLWPEADGGWDGYVCDGEVVFRPADAEESTRRPVAWFARAGR